MVGRTLGSVARPLKPPFLRFFACMSVQRFNSELRSAEADLEFSRLQYLYFTKRRQLRANPVGCTSYRVLVHNREATKPEAGIVPPQCTDALVEKRAPRG